MKFKLTIHPTAVYLDKDKLDDKTVANIAFASNVVQKLHDGLILETSLSNPGAWRLPYFLLKRLY